MKKIGFLLIYVCCALNAVNAQQNDVTPAFKAGEKLTYTVSYSAAMWPNTDMGNLVITITNDNVGGEPALRIDARATVKGMFAWFYELDDRYHTWLANDDFMPLKSTAELREGDYRFSSEFVYDWNKKVSENTFRNHRNPIPTRMEVALERDAMDGVALFYNLRLHDIASYTPGQSRTLPLLLKDKVQFVKYKYYGRETISVHGLGKVKTLKFSCQLVNDDAASFEEGSEFFVWISDDGNKVPVYLESPLKVGRVRARLTSYGNLMYKTGSALK